MKKLLVILLLLYANIASAQQIVWEKSFTYNNTDSKVFDIIRKTSDGGFITSGIHYPDFYTLFVKYDSNGDTAWVKARTIELWTGEQDLVQTRDGGYAFVGAHMNFANFINRSDILLVRLNAAGDTLWTRKYDPFQHTDFTTGLLLLPDNGFLITATVQNPGPPQNYEDYYLIRTDSLGNVLWQQAYGGFLGEISCHSTITSKGTFIISGASNSYSGMPAISHPHLMEISSSGAVLNQKRVVVKDPNEFAAIYRLYNNLIVSSDGGYVFSARADTAGAKSFGVIAKVDTAFNLLWTHVERPQTQDVFKFTKVKQLADSTYIALGDEQNIASNKFVLVRLSRTGQLLSRQTFTASHAMIRMYDFELMGDSSLVAVGACWPTAFAPGRGYLVKVGQVGMPMPPLVVNSVPEPMPARQMATLGQNYPNPFTGETTVTYKLAEEVQQAELAVMEIVTGRVVKRLALREREGSVSFNGSDLASGIYAYGIVAGGQLLVVKKLSVIR